MGPDVSLKIYCDTLANASETMCLLANFEEDTESGIAEAQEANSQFKLLIDRKIDPIVQGVPGLEKKLYAAYEAACTVPLPASKTRDRLYETIAKAMGWHLKKDAKAISGLIDYLGRVRIARKTV